MFLLLTSPLDDQGLGTCCAVVSAAEHRKDLGERRWQYFVRLNVNQLQNVRLRTLLITSKTPCRERGITRSQESVTPGRRSLANEPRAMIRIKPRPAFHGLKPSAHRLEPPFNRRPKSWLFGLHFKPGPAPGGSDDVWWAIAEIAPRMTVLRLV